MKIPGNVRIDSPADPLLKAGVSYWGITTGAGAATGLTLVDALCSTAGRQPSYVGMGVKLLTGDASGQARTITAHDLATGAITVGTAFTDFNGAVYQVPAGIIFCIGAVGVGGGGSTIPSIFDSVLPHLAETWQNVLGIDFTVWTQVLGGGGTVTRSVATEPYQEVILAGVAAGDTARLHSVQEWQLAPDTYGTDTIIQRLIMQWESRILNVADVDNALFLVGLGPIAASTRATNNIAGVILVGDAYNFVTDAGGVETLTALPSAPAVNVNHKFTLVAYAGTIELYCDETLEVTHTTNLPDVNAHGQFYMAQEGGGGGTGALHVGIVGIRPDCRIN